jgi:hypothetical protein
MQSAKLTDWFSERSKGTSMFLASCRVAKVEAERKGSAKCKNYILLKLSQINF